jgi:hypothetical protein
MAGTRGLVSELRSKLAVVLRGFDDDAYVAIANRGLLRRAQKELEKQSVAIVEERSDALVVSFAEQQITFDARGPAHARCTCPASGVCQHILAAAMGLQRLESSSAAASPSEDADQVLERLRQELLKLSTAELTKHAGKAGYRWAWQFLHDLPSEHEVQIGGTRSITIAFPHPPLAFRYAGGGLESIVCDTDRSKIEKYRVAAVLAFQRAHGATLSAPEAPAPKAIALDLGKDHAASDSSAGSLDDIRRRLRTATLELLEECVTLGLSHLSEGVQERFATLAVWAQGAEYYRLALLLRRLADHVEQLLERAGGADEHRMLDEMALAYGLVSALEQAHRAGSAPTSLVGRARTQYEEAKSLELLGLGARPWRTGSGYVGLTMLFWVPATREFLACTDARPENQRAFNPIARYKMPGPWSGLGSPSQATGKRIHLIAPQLNGAGRVSASEKTSATLQPASFSELVAQLQPVKSWDAIAAARSAERRSLLSEPQPMKDWFVLQPAAFGDAQFDGARQTLFWPLIDATGNELTLELPFSALSEHAMARIEALESGANEDKLVVARISTGSGALSGEPLSLIRPGSSATDNPVDALFFDDAPKQGFVSKWLGKLRNPLAGGDMANPIVGETRVIPTALREVREWLQRSAEQGIAGDSARRMQPQFAAVAKQAEDAGFGLFAPLSARPEPLAQRLLRAHYVCLQHERLLDDGTAGFTY